MAGAVGIAFDRSAVDLGGDAAHYLAGTAGQEELDIDMLEQRVLLGRVGFLPLAVEMGGVARLAVEQPLGQIDEGLEVGLALDLRDHDIGRSHDYLNEPPGCGTPVPRP